MFLKLGLSGRKAKNDIDNIEGSGAWKIWSSRTILGAFSLAYPGSPEELYMGRTYITTMTRKDKMREGFVARTFHIPKDVDDELRMMAVKDHLRFSEMAILAFKGHISRNREAS